MRNQIKKTFCVFVGLILLTISLLTICQTYASYTANTKGETSLSIASPFVNLKVDDEKTQDLLPNQNIIKKFYVSNYDNTNMNHVELEYKIVILDKKTNSFPSSLKINLYYKENNKLMLINDENTFFYLPDVKNENDKITHSFLMDLSLITNEETYYEEMNNDFQKNIMIKIDINQKVVKK